MKMYTQVFTDGHREEFKCYGVPEAIRYADRLSDQRMKKNESFGFALYNDKGKNIYQYNYQLSTSGEVVRK